MRIENEGVITHPLDVVYKTLRDKLVEMIPFLPNIKEIKVLDRKELSPEKIYILNHWQGTMDQVPAVAKPFLKPEMIAWKDHANWDNPSYSVSWRFETYTGKKLFSCEGKNQFTTQTANETKLVISGELVIHPENIPGIPTFMARKFAPIIENFLLGRIAPNLKDLIVGLQKYLDSTSK